MLGFGFFFVKKVSVLKIFLHILRLVHGRGFSDIADRTYAMTPEFVEFFRYIKFVSFRYGEECLVREVMIKDDEMPVLFAVFAVFVHIEDLDAFLKMVITVAAKFFFEFLNIREFVGIMIPGFFFVVSEGKEAGLVVEAGVEYTAHGELEATPFSTDDTGAAVEDFVCGELEYRVGEREVTEVPAGIGTVT